MKTIKTGSITIDIAVCLLMALMIYVVFPFGRWIDHATLSTVLLLGFYYLNYVVNRAVTVPSFFKAGRRPLSVLILASFALLMSALTCYRAGWPFYQLADAGKVTLGQQRAWLFFLVVQLASITVGIFAELTRLRISHQTSAVERDRLQQQTITVKSERKNILINLADILYIESKNNYVYFFLSDGRQLKTQLTLASLSTMLPPDEFIRIHKSFIVARSHVRSFNSRELSVGGVTLSIGRTYGKTFALQDDAI